MVKVSLTINPIDFSANGMKTMDVIAAESKTKKVIGVFNTLDKDTNKASLAILAVDSDNYGKHLDMHSYDTCKLFKVSHTDEDENCYNIAYSAADVSLSDAIDDVKFNSGIVSRIFDKGMTAWDALHKACTNSNWL